MDATYWHGFERKTGKLTWRLAVPADQPAIDRLREASQRRLREIQKDVELFARPVVVAFVAENLFGDIVDCLYVEAQVEIVKIGLSEDSFMEVDGIAPELNEWLKGMGFKTATIRTRKSLTEMMSVVLEYLGFTCEDKAFSRWTRDL